MKRRLETLSRRGLDRRLLFLGWVLIVAAGVITALVFSGSGARGILVLILMVVLIRVMAYIHARKDRHDPD